MYQIFSVLGALVIFGLVIDFIRRGLLKEKYSVLWLASALAILALSIKKSFLDTIAIFLGVDYPPSLLFLVALLFVLLMLLHFSVVISIFHEKNKVLTQEITLLKNTLEEAGVIVRDEAKKAGEAEKAPKVRKGRGAGGRPAGKKS
ncbi:MAG: hypothetical protein BMS9Abin23_1079 [Thermodesulfobacteriota bacterium]|nr:MAG: hypothetical protein BMS9Abin23_1079 [Thermodesulfobacteriota bacterium]